MNAIEQARFDPLYEQMFQALTYLGKYLYRGVLQEKDILRCDNGEVTFRYTEEDRKTSDAMQDLRRNHGDHRDPHQAVAPTNTATTADMRTSSGSAEVSR